MAMTNIIKFIKWNFTEMESWKYRYMAYFCWVIGLSAYDPGSILALLGLAFMFTDFTVTLVMDSYRRFKNEQDG
jgi:hypothetical protein